ncbi:MucR family transcriptional regulator [Inquilinus sp. NPDC058860]|uniref:MucR family transcriptional regulator n=1 Tax=Inquilinus sp. NPDC058860 TaxID=3346652 RepID=UPI0036BD19DE
MSETGATTIPAAGDETRRLATQIVSAHVGNNSVALADLPGLIAQVYGALERLGKPTEPVISRPEPAVPIRKSVTPDAIICLEDGKKLKMLKRHLASAYNMTPDQYRARWGLASDYPMVAPNYAQQRSTLAKKIGLGTGRGKPPAEPVAPAPKPAKAPRARKPAAAKTA